MTAADSTRKYFGKSTVIPGEVEISVTLWLAHPDTGHKEDEIILAVGEAAVSLSTAQAAEMQRLLNEVMAALPFIVSRVG